MVEGKVVGFGLDWVSILTYFKKRSTQVWFIFVIYLIFSYWSLAIGGYIFKKSNIKSKLAELKLDSLKKMISFALLNKNLIQAQRIVYSS